MDDAGDKARKAYDLLATQSDDQIVTMTGLDLAEIVAMRALRATEPFPPEVKKPLPPVR